MNRINTIASTLTTLSLLVAGCSANVEAPQEAGAATSGETLCYNRDGINSVMSALATATAIELRRWNAPVDFRWNDGTGMLELTGAGKARCWGGVCKNVQAILDMQRWEANGIVTFDGGIKLNVANLRNEMKDSFNRQVRCNNWWDEFKNNGCWVETHDLWYDHTEKGSCSSKDFFWQNKAGTSLSLDVPDRLQYQLYFAGYPNNRMLNWYLRNGQASVDPTVGLTEMDYTESGSCAALCSQYSSTSVAGQCCSCNGVTKKFSRSPFSSGMYLCR